MKVFEECNERAIKEIYKIANENIATPSNFDTQKTTFIFRKESAVCNFFLRDVTGFENPLLKSCYVLSITFCVTGNGNPFIQDFNHKKAAEIIKTFYGDNLPLVFEHAPYTKEGVSSKTYHFCLFVSIPYDKKAVALKEEDYKELLKNNYVLYEQDEKK